MSSIHSLYILKKFFPNKPNCLFSIKYLKFILKGFSKNISFQHKFSKKESSSQKICKVFFCSKLYKVKFFQKFMKLNWEDFAKNISFKNFKTTYIYIYSKFSKLPKILDKLKISKFYIVLKVSKWNIFLRSCFSLLKDLEKGVFSPSLIEIFSY